MAREMERQGFKLPLLIGGATTSRAHTAVKIAPHYSEPVVHVLDASRAVPVTTSLLSDEGKRGIRGAAPRASTRRSARRMRRHRQELVSLEAARAQADARSSGAPRICRRRQFTGVRVLDDFPLATLREFIDWTPFFHTWELKGVYPRILEDEKYGRAGAADFRRSQRAARRIIEEKLLTARGVYGFFPANAVGDDVELYADGARTTRLERFHFLRQQSRTDGSEPCRSLGDFIAPDETRPARTTSAAFAVTTGIGLKELSRPVHAPSTTTTTPSWRRRSPIGWPRRLPSACTSGCATNGATGATRT